MVETVEKISCVCYHDKSVHEHDGVGKCLVCSWCPAYFKLVMRVPATKT